MSKKILIPLILVAVLLIGAMAWVSGGHKLPSSVAELTVAPDEAAATPEAAAPSPAPTPEPTPVPHDHVWEDGVCTICGEPCPHERHDAKTLLCESCGARVEHSYVNCVCELCGARPQFLAKPGDFPEEIFAATEEHGTVKTFHFGLEEGEILPGVRARVTREDIKSREMVVYTPYGYDPDKSYNVLIVAPAAGHSAHQWLEKNNRISVQHSRVPARELLDGMIANGYIEPLIVVVVEYYLHGKPAQIAPGYAKTLRERVLPYIAANYGTYASVDENGVFIPAPEHFAFEGASFGGMIGWQMLPECTDLFSYWGFLSGGYLNDEEITQRIIEGVSAEHPIHYLYAGDGKKIETWTSYRNRVDKLEKSCECLEYGKNCCFSATERAGHEYAAWDVGLFNSLQVFFLNRFASSPATE